MKGNDMTAFFKRHSTFILLLLLVTLLALAWIYPSEGLFLGITFLLFSFLAASLAVLDKHRQAYRQGRIGRGTMLRNAVLEITGTWVVMAAAGLLGRSAAQAATQGIGHDLLRVSTGLAVGVLVGIGVGVVGRKTLRRLVVVSPRAEVPGAIPASLAPISERKVTLP
jgi:hypothetical protein